MWARLLRSALGFASRPTQKRFVAAAATSALSASKHRLAKVALGAATFGSAVSLIASASADSSAPIAVVYNSVRNVTYKITKRIAEGAYGIVYECEDLFGQVFVVKVLKSQWPHPIAHQDWTKEVSVMSQMNHPNIISLVDAFVFNSQYHLVFEKADGNLRDFINKNGALSESQVISLASQILSDPEGKPIIKIGDFGLSTFLPPGERRSYDYQGRPYEYAPELLRYGHTSKKSDLYQAISTLLPQRRAASLGTPLGNVIAQLLGDSPQRQRDCTEVWYQLSQLSPEVNENKATLRSKVSVISPPLPPLPNPSLSSPLNPKPSIPDHPTTLNPQPIPISTSTSTPSNPEQPTPDQPATSKTAPKPLGESEANIVVPQLDPKPSDPKSSGTQPLASNPEPSPLLSPPSLPETNSHPSQSTSDPNPSTPPHPTLDSSLSALPAPSESAANPKSSSEVNGVNDVASSASHSYPFERIY